jgi:Sulfatase
MLPHMLKKFYHTISPFHFFLLIPFFLLHNINYYFGLIPYPLVYSSLFAFLALTVSVFLIAKVLLKTNLKAGIYSFITMSYFFGFGAVKDFLDSSPKLHKLAAYSIMLPVIFIMLMLLLIYLKKSEKNFKKLNTFLFIAIAANLLLEIFLFAKNNISDAEKQNDLGDASLTISKNYNPCSNCNQPDIFYIIFDEYASSLSLKENFNFNNSDIDDFLSGSNFFVSKLSKSNYCFTSFSLSATFKMDYLNLPPGYTEADSRDLARGEYTVYNNNVINILEKQGYTIYNNSIFDIKDHPSALGTYFFPLRKMFLNDETLLGRVKRDVGWNINRFLSKKERIKASQKATEEHVSQVLNNFNTAFNYAKQSINNEDPQKKEFFYFHFMIPHDPFIFDSLGNVKYYTDFGRNLKEKYIDQLKYSNKKLKEIVTLIQEKYQKKAVIILQGDHGFKQWPGEPNFWNIAFQNLNAVYLPDNNYAGFYDGFSSVNTFRLLFNHYFNSGFEILPDRSIPVFVKKDLKKNYGIRQDKQ